MKDIFIPYDISLATKEENFLLNYSGPDDKDCYLIFGTKENPEILKLNSVWHTNG